MELLIYRSPLSVLVGLHSITVYVFKLTSFMLHHKDYGQIIITSAFCENIVVFTSHSEINGQNIRTQYDAGAVSLLVGRYLLHTIGHRTAHRPQ